VSGPPLPTPGGSLVLSRAQATDVAIYRAAKERAEREGLTFEIAPE